MKAFGKNLAASLPLLFVAAAVLSPCLAACSRTKVEEEKPPRSVVAAPVELRDFTIFEDHAALIKSAKEIDITPKIGGRVVSVKAELGDHVEKGAVLFTLDSADYEDQYKQAAAALATAKASLARTSDSGQEQQIIQAKAQVDQAAVASDDAASFYEKTKRLYDSGALAKQQLDDAEARAKSAKIQLDAAREALKLIQDKAGSQASDIAASQVEAARAQADLAQNQLADTSIRAPISGRISYRGLEQGEMVNTSTLAFIVIDDSSVMAEAGLSERQIGFVRKGMPISVVVPALAPENQGGSKKNEAVFPGIVDSLSPATDPQSQLYTVKVRLANPRGELRGGMLARIRIPVESRHKAKLLPERAIFTENSGDFVFALSRNAAGDYQVHKLLIQIGETDGDYAEVLSGLEAGESVVVEGKEFVGDGDRVTVDTASK